MVLMDYFWLSAHKLFLVVLGAGIWDAGDQSHVSCVQGKCLPHSAIALPR